MTKDPKCQAIVELLFKLAEDGAVIEFSGHMGETVIDWKKGHDHVNYFSKSDKIDSLLSILARIHKDRLYKDED